MPRAKLIAILSSALAASAQAQQAAPPPPTLPRDGPGSVTLAPLPADRAEVMEEIVVIGRDGWNLPELGGMPPPEPEPEGPWQINWLPLYDPESPPEDLNLFQAATEQQRGNFVELFRIRFGAPPGETDDGP
jgi:hypothetical protein